MFVEERGQIPVLILVSPMGSTSFISGPQLRESRGVCSTQCSMIDVIFFPSFILISLVPLKTLLMVVLVLKTQYVYLWYSIPFPNKAN